MDLNKKTVLILGICIIIAAFIFRPSTTFRTGNVSPTGAVFNATSDNTSSSVSNAVTLIAAGNTGRLYFSACIPATTTPQIGAYVSEFSSGITPTSTINPTAGTYFSSTTGQFIYAGGPCYELYPEKYLNTGSIYMISASGSTNIVKVAIKEITAK